MPQSDASKTLAGDIKRALERAGIEFVGTPVRQPRDQSAPKLSTSED